MTHRPCFVGMPHGACIDGILGAGEFNGIGLGRLTIGGPSVLGRAQPFRLH
jgi:hypothetical protein